MTNVTEHKRAAVLGRIFRTLCLEQQRIWALKKTLHWRLDVDRGGELKWGISNKEREMYRNLQSLWDWSLEDRLSTKVGLLSGGQGRHNPSDVNIKEAKALAA